MTPPKELTELIDFGFDLGTSVAAALKDDGKVSLIETAAMLKHIGSARDALSGIGQIDDELKNLTLGQVEELNAHIASRLTGHLSERQTQVTAAVMGLLGPLVNLVNVLKQPAGTDAPVAVAEPA